MGKERFMHGFGHFHSGALGGFLFVVFIALVVLGMTCPVMGFFFGQVDIISFLLFSF